MRRILVGLVVFVPLVVGGTSAYAAPGDIYTYDPVSNPGSVPRILKIDPNGAQAAVATGTFDAASAFGLAREPGGTLVLANGNQANLARIDPGTGGVTYFGVGLGTPRGIAIDPQTGDIYITDQTGDFIYKVDPASGVKTPLANDGALNTVRGITIGPGGDLFINDNAGVFRLSKSGGVPALVKSGAPLANPQDIVAGTDGNLYVTNFGGELVQVTPGGATAVVASGAPITNLNGAALDANGKVIFSDQAAFGNAAIFRFDGAVSTVASGNLLEDPRGMAAEPLVPPSGGTTPPDKSLTATITAKKSQKLKRTITIDVSCPQEACIVSASGSLNVPKVNAAKRYKLKRVSKTLKAGEKGKLKLKLSKKVRNKAKRALRKRKKVKAKIAVTANDAAGNKSSRTLRIRLKR